MFSFTDQLVVVECANCHMNFGITKAFNEQKKKDHSGFTCPAGHSNVYNGQTEEEKMRLENQQLKQNSAYQEDRIKELLKGHDTKNHRIAGLKGTVTKIKKRVSCGVCPCCNRNFANLARHMDSQHPKYTKEAV